MKMITLEEVNAIVMDNLEHEARIATLEHGCADLDYEEFVEEWTNCEFDEFIEAREAARTLRTSHGDIDGWFVGTVAYGDKRDMAFKTRTGKVYRVWKINGSDEWNVENPNKVGGKICWDEYPEDWNAVWTRPDTVKIPRKPEKKRLSDFVDSRYRTDAGDFLYAVILTGKYKCEMYAGHNRKIAAKYMKKYRRSGENFEVRVYPVHRQDEYDVLPY